MNMVNSIDGVIWITGYSASGKTTLARKVVSNLNERGYKVVHFDGDELRSVLGDGWGYDKKSRIKLSKLYMKLCAHLAKQGCVVVVSAIAMFDEAEIWLRSNVLSSLQVYLDVPLKIREVRDINGKKIFSNIDFDESIYDIPKNFDVMIENYGENLGRPWENLIVDKFIECGRGRQDERTDHWNAYYKQGKAPLQPSSFALSLQPLIAPASTLLEVGTGNGRDASYFASLGVNVIAIDKSQAAIDFCRASYAQLPIDFFVGTLPDAHHDFSSVNFDSVYLRFVLHAMPLNEEIELIEKCHLIMKGGAKLMIECRSINDPLAAKGKVISDTERVYGHYRRFIIMNVLCERLLSSGFKILDAIESSELASLQDDNPVVIRVIAER
jgi:bifunctional enzyme CysN/CysC